MDTPVTEQPAEPISPLVIEHEERTVDQGQLPDDGPSELQRHKEARGYTKPPVKTDPEPPPLPEAAAGEPLATPEPQKKKDERLTDPDTGDVYDMRHKVARRIKSLLDERGLTREEVKRLRAENEEYRRAVLQGRAPAGHEPPKPQPTGDADPEPDPADTAKYPEGQFDRAFMRDMSKWAARQETKQFAQTSRDQQEQQQREQAELAAVNRWQQSLPEIRKRYADFDAVIERIPNTPENALIVQMMLGSPVGSDVVYVLGTQPEAMEMYRRAPSQHDRMRLLHHIEAQLIQHQRTAAAKQPPPRTTNAPPPTTPVQTGPAPTVIDWSRTDDPDQYARYKAMRAQRR